MNKFEKGKTSEIMVDTNHEDKDIHEYKFKDVFIIHISSQKKRSITHSGQRK